MNPLQQGLKHLGGAYLRGVCLSCNNESTTTRIETWITIDCVWYHFLVAIMNPLQQGLKHIQLKSISLHFHSCNNESTTTRIETSDIKKE